MKKLLSVLCLAIFLQITIPYASYAHHTHVGHINIGVQEHYRPTKYHHTNYRPFLPHMGVNITIPMQPGIYYNNYYYPPYYTNYYAIPKYSPVPQVGGYININL